LWSAEFERQISKLLFTNNIEGSSDHTVKVWQLQGSLAYETATIEHMAVESMISKWTCEEVVNWLAEVGLGDLGHVFESNEISGDKLATLTDALLTNELKIGTKFKEIWD